MKKKDKGVIDIPGVTTRKNKLGTITYDVTVYMGRDAKGYQMRRYASYTPPAGESKRETRKALEVLRQELLTSRVNEHSRESAQTVAQFSEFFLEDRKAAGCTPHTLFNYKRCLKRINEELGTIPLNKLTTSMIDRFYRKLENTEKPSSAVAAPSLKKAVKARKLTQTALASRAGLSSSTVRNALYGRRVSVDTAQRISDALQVKMERHFVIGKAQTLSVETVLSYHRVLRDMLQIAKKKKLIAYNEAEDVTLPKRPDQEAMTLQPDQIQALLEAVEEGPLMWQALIHCYLVTGARRGELCGLLWENLDFDSATVTINHARLYEPDEGTFSGPTKTRQNRYIKLPPQTIELLRLWKREQESTAQFFGAAEDGKDYVFTWEGQPLHPDSITSHVHLLSEKTCIDGLHTHTLRHTAASVLIGAGIDLATVAGHLGHRDAGTTTKIYIHAIERNKAAAAEALGGVIYGNKGDEKE